MRGKRQGSALEPARRAPPSWTSRQGHGPWTAIHWVWGRSRGALLILLLLLPLATHAVEPAERLPDPALETRARAISAELRCLVCQNESIDDSHAGLARDIRALVRRRLTLGDTDTATVQAVVDRYGDFVLLRPPVRRATWLLWYGPAALLLTGLAAIALWLRRRPLSTQPPAPLTEAEQHRLAAMMREDGA